MDYRTRCAMASDLLRKGREFGADIIGFADVSQLKNGPSEQLFPLMKDHSRDHFAERVTTGLPQGAVFWEEDASCAVVFGVAHPQEEPELDWWMGSIDPPGNKKLIQVGKALAQYLGEKYPQVTVYPKAYHVEKGGLYLKEAAYYAGLGCIGRNNLLITPEFGPRVRLRAILLNAWLPPTGPTSFDPCRDCGQRCMRNCPQNAFAEQIYSPEEFNLDFLPGRVGNYARKQCALEMKQNEADAVVEALPPYAPEPVKITRYCRNCEFDCVLGRPYGE